MSIATKYQKLQEEITALQAQQPVQIIAISKYATDEQVIEAYQAGIRDFGENYVQPCLDKKSRLAECIDVEQINWHLIGHLQKNKVNKAVGVFELIQSVDSLELARKINKRAEDLGIKQKILLQVKVSDEESKTGFEFAQLARELKEICTLGNIQVQGFMCVAPNHQDPQMLGTIFRSFRLDCLKIWPQEQDLRISMGMSNDFALAISEGSTMIRIGKLLFE